MNDGFYSFFRPDEPRIEVPKEELVQYAELIPAELQMLWKKDGFGTYNQGLLQLIDPKAYKSVLHTWLGKETPNYVPFAITAYGELFYFRKLTPTDHDVCLIDIQFRGIEVLTWDMNDFLNRFLLDPMNQTEWLRVELFNDAIEIHEKLQLNEVFTLAPILAFGGHFVVANLSKGNAQVYQDLVFSMTS